MKKSDTLGYRLGGAFQIIPGAQVCYDCNLHSIISSCGMLLVLRAPPEKSDPICSPITITHYIESQSTSGHLYKLYIN